MKTLLPLLLLLSLSVCVSLPPMAAEETPGERIKKLQQERLETATQLYQETVARSKNGVNSRDEMWKAQHILLEARLDLCATRKARLDVYAEMLKAHDEMELIVKHSYEAGGAAHSELYEAKLERLQLEIRMEKEKEAP